MASGYFTAYGFKTGAAQYALQPLRLENKFSLFVEDKVQNFMHDDSCYTIVQHETYLFLNYYQF